MGYLVYSNHAVYVQVIWWGIWYIATIQYTCRRFDGFLVCSYHAGYVQEF